MSKSTSSSKKTAWKGIQKKSSDVACDRAESIGSQDSQKNSDQKVNRHTTIKRVCLAYI